MQRPLQFFIYSGFLFLSLFGSTVTGEQGTEQASSIPEYRGDIARGKKLLPHCSNCHGSKGYGDPSKNIPHIAGQQLAYMELAARSYVEGGRKHEGMQKTIAELSDTQLKDVLSYYASLENRWKNTTQPDSNDTTSLQAQINAGKALSKPCQACHGIDGNSKIPGLPSLAGLSENYLNKAFTDYFNGKRIDSMMQAFSLSTSKSQVKQLAAYYANLPRSRSQITAKTKITKTKIVAMCNGCHGVEGNSANPNIPSINGHDAKYLRKAILAYNSGLRKNPAMESATKKLSPTDINQLAKYYAAQTPVKPIEKSKFGFKPLKEGKYLANSCNSCHGTNGNSELPGIPSLAAQPFEYLITSIKAYQTNRRKSDLMKPVIGHLSDLDIEKISLYYSNQKSVKKSYATRPLPEHAGSCSGCHGENGNSSSQETPSLAGQDNQYLIKAIGAYSSGRRKHKDMQNAVKALNKAEIKQLANYYSVQHRTQAKKLSFESPETLAKKCNRCHGDNGYSVESIKPRLAGQIKSYLLKSLREYQNDSRENSMMHAMSDVLSLTEMDAIATYYSSK